MRPMSMVAGFLTISSTQFTRFEAGHRSRANCHRLLTLKACAVRRETTHRPRLVVFDLDGTLWNPAMYQLWGGGGAPFRRAPSGHAVIDCSGTRVRLLGNSAAVLAELKRSDVMVGLASSTDEPEWADECMRKIRIDGQFAMKDCIDLEQIHKGPKRTHFEALHRVSHIGYEDMIFFDNENRNIESVRPLGVLCCHCPDGMTGELWDRALKEFGMRSSTPV